MHFAKTLICMFGDVSLPKIKLSWEKYWVNHFLPGEELKSTKIILGEKNMLFGFQEFFCFVFITRPKATRGQKHMPNVSLSSL